MPHAVAAAASATVGSITDQVLVRPSQIEHTTADGTNSAATSRAGLTWRCTASEDSANRPATVPNVENAPNRTQTSATPNGQRRRHHSEMQQRAPSATSVATRPEVIRLAASSTVTRRMRAPSAAAMTKAPASTDQSRAVLGATSSGCAASLGASIAAGAVCAHHLRSQDMVRSYGSGPPCNIDERRQCNRRKNKRRKRPASLRTSDRGRPPDAAAHRPVQAGHMITTTALTKSYNKMPVVRDVSLRCEPGTITGFLGANGAGKSTTLKMIVGLVRPDRGTATIDGRPFVELPNPTRVVGTLLDASAMHPGRSGRATLTIAARLAGVHTRRVEHLLDLVGIADAAEKRVGTYSLGMRQRLGVAQALVGEPRVLILDEPANGLDPDGIAWMRTLLRDFADHGGTVLLSSHLLHEVQATADHLVVVSGGAVVAAGRLDDLLASSTILVRSPDPVALAAALQAARIDYVAGPDDVLTVDVSGGRVTTEVVAGVARDHQVLLTELRRSETNGLEQLFFSLTAAKAAPHQEAAA